jgi:cyanophycinase-like exopeptidase
MRQAAGCRVLAIMGSGETSPTMVTVHRAIVARLADHPGAVLLETPYRFQENASGISAKAKKYFADSVGLDVTPLAGTRPQAGAEGEDGGAGAVRSAGWVFAGPGSPTYALAQWRDSPVGDALRDRVAAAPGATVLASAAAVTIGVAALPVYEIYKAGAAPHWLDGLDLLGALGLRFALIPHYDNAEGGTHDTRYCYLGERRLSLLERELPAGVAVLGVDEHTAAVFDLAAETVEVSGRGGVTVRRRGVSTVLPAGTLVPLAALRDLVSKGIPPGAGGPATAGAGHDAGAGHGATGAVEGAPGTGHGAGAPARATARSQAADQAADRDGGTPRALPDIVTVVQRRFDAAERGRDAAAMVTAIIDLEAAIHAWSADTDEDQGTEQARAVLRALVTRLGAAARDGLGDPRDRLRPAVEPLLRLRDLLRREGSFPAADAIRDALTAAGLELRDNADRTQWQLDPTGQPAAPTRNPDR